MVQCIDCNSRNYCKNFERLVFQFENVTIVNLIDVDRRSSSSSYNLLDICEKGIVSIVLEEDFRKISSTYQ